MSQSHFLRNALILGLLTAIGPFAIDMYLPSLPSIGKSLNADSDRVLLSMTAFFASFAIGQLIYGPLSDMFGRKPPLYFGIGLFAAASIGCALSDNIETLIVFRLIQGLGGAAGTVIARAIVRDLHSGVEEAKLFSLLMLVFSVSPLLAPMIGTMIIELASWRAIFWLVMALALLGLVMVMVSIRETRHADQRESSTMRGMIDATKLLLVDTHFMGLTFIASFALAGFFVFLANSSFILMGHYHLSTTAYSLAFSGNAAAFFASSQLTGWLGGKFGLHALVRPAMFGYAIAIALLLIATTAGVENLWLLGALFFISNAFLGVVLPVTSVLSLAHHGPIAGTAASLGGTLQLVTGSIVMAASSRFANGTTKPMVLCIVACGAIAFVLSVFTLRGSKFKADAAASAAASASAS
ncbi:MAG TPA: multidrug effflux MFS transporter [Magnetospirillaceae bacterium]|jgi:DHA1 family bicyclomycin/chloramphenicol resistance-like MFS transporter